MGMGTIHSMGKKHRIYAYFQYQGVRHHETTQFYCETGKKGCKCRGCNTARAWLIDIENQIEDGVFQFYKAFPKSKTEKDMTLIPADPDITFGAYAVTWLESQEKVFAASTYKTYSTSINNLLSSFGKFPLKTIKPMHIRAYINSSKLSPKTIKNHLGTMSSIITSAIQDELIDKSPISAVKMPHIASEEVDPFSIAEISEILKWINANHPHMTTFFAVAFYTGMRTGEIMALKWSDIDFRKHTITVQRTMTVSKLKDSTKTADRRTIDIITELDEYLISHKQYTYMKSEFMFLASTGKPFRKSENITKTYWKPCLKALGMRFRTLYQTRHTFACVQLDLGESLNWIKKMLGHSTLEMITKRYGNRIDKTEGRKGGKISQFAQDLHKISNEKI